MKIANGKVKLVKYTEDGAYLAQTINEGEKIPTQVLTVKGEDVNGDTWDLYVIDDRDDDYEEKRDAFFENEGTYVMSVLLDECGVTGHHEEPEIEDIYCEVDSSPYQVVYDTSESPEVNQNAIRDYFQELYWSYSQYTPLELVYQISNFFKYHIIDVVECLGGMEGVNKLWKELIETYALDPAFNAGIKEEIRLSSMTIEEANAEMSEEEAKKWVEEQLAKIDVNEYVQDVEAKIDAYCAEAEETLKRLKKSKTPLEVECEKIKLYDKVKHLTVGEKVAALYRRLVPMGELDVDMGNVPIKRAYCDGTLMEDIPAAMTDYFEQESKKGCCFVFSTVLMKYLHDLGVKTWLIGTEEGTDTRASFMYVDSSGLPFVANPVADIEYFKENGVTSPEDRLRCFTSDRFDASFGVRGNRHNYGKISLHEFEEMYGPITLYGDFYDKKFEGVKFSEVAAKPLDVREVYERLGKHWDYEWFLERRKTRAERAKRRAEQQQGGQETPENPDDQEV